MSKLKNALVFMALFAFEVNVFAAPTTTTPGGQDTVKPGLGGATPGNGIGSPSGDPNIDNIHNAKCPNTNLLSFKMISATCWSCIFPIITMGTLSLGASKDEAPEGRATKPVCMCKDKLGVPYPGFTYGMWQPSKALELVRMPGCLATLDGAQLGFDTSRMGLWPNVDKNLTKGFAQYHFYAYPLLLVLDMFAKAECVKDHYGDIDILFFSEVDPTWSDDMIAYFTNPEAILFGNPVAALACIPDALSATYTKRPISSLYWCAGSWGSMFPLTGHMNLPTGAVTASSIMAAKMLMAMHRRGVMQKTFSPDALCKQQLAIILPKEQYKLSMLYPVPETNTAHVIGQSEIIWGSNRVVPVTGEDFIYLLFNWVDCCMSFTSGNANQ